ncbi:hypothetical protein VMHJH2_09385 [Streptococcus uberis]|uniref:hypothetical protein n=1 Tax=Streptococcus uberis TaxID=1349 RepID=UPI00214FB0F3|nr:hypothetical protein [Streptococcus uberis]MCR4258731.1 hypothetical protein [Streptococcus uberis]
MKNENGKLIVSKSHFGNMIRNCHSVEEFKESFERLTYYSSENRESTLRQRLKIAEKEYNFKVSVKEDLETENTTDKEILDYVRNELSKIDSKKEADKNWADKNRERRNYLSKRSSARSFINNNATNEDLLELKKIIEEKLK